MILVGQVSTHSPSSCTLPYAIMNQQASGTLAQIFVHISQTEKIGMYKGYCLKRFSWSTIFIFYIMF